jgi:hypothetical protein
MKFAAGLTVTGILGFLLMEALKTVMVPVAAWLVGLVVLVLKVLLIALVVLAVGGMVALGVFLYKRGQKSTAEA